MLFTFPLAKIVPQGLKATRMTTLMPGINPRPSTKPSFSAASKSPGLAQLKLFVDPSTPKCLPPANSQLHNVETPDPGLSSGLSSVKFKSRFAIHGTPGQAEFEIEGLTQARKALSAKASIKCLIK
jgi:hypothetical protein